MESLDEIAAGAALHGRKPVVKETDLHRYHGSSRACFRPAEQVNRHGCQTARRTPYT